ncbi:TonB-dependent receptor [Pseudoflavitalea rhizosphaerae]|uniref:TonB-dependent receptor n=1 Tax=Pseudoflavitalea rhizosphaerae TaxID=1884793 RepID=UPI000F8DFB98|nr:TonB-dependent receptor [Pseudoflavitalea rhizosphaerae]
MQIKALCDQAAIVWRGLGTKTILKTMKLTAFFMLAFSLSISASGLAQTVTLSGKEIPLKKIFAEIEKQTGYFVVWSKDQISHSKPVDVQASKQPLESFIKQVLKDQPLEYTIENQTIFIRLKKSPPSKNQLSITVAADPVTGYVKDSNGEPLTGATVTIKGTSISVATGIKGYFSINAQPGQTLIFSFVGYETQEQKVGTGEMLVVLPASANALDEMVIIGYGTAMRRSNTGTVATVKNKDIVSQPVADPLAALQGRVAGLFVSTTSGFRGSNFTVRLRGQNSIGEGNDPLYIVDGVPYFSESLDQFTSAGGNQSPLASINPTDIERIDVLKDADATAIYGSRGANGVILITTRKGKAGKTQFDFNIYSGASKVTNKVDMLSTPEYVALRKEAFANDGGTPDDQNAPDLVLWDQNKATDWQDLIIGNTAKLTQVQASVSGGNEQTRFLLSTSYRNETTVLPNDLPFRRGAVYLNLDHSSVDKKFNITASVNYSGIKDRSLASDVTSFYNMAPNYPIYDDEGKFYWFGTLQNPMAYLQRRNTNKTKNLVANSVIRYTVLPGLSVKTRLGLTQTNMDQMQVYPKVVFNPTSSIGSMTYFGNSEVSSYIIEPQVDYTRKIGEGKLQLLAGGSWQENTRQGKSFIADGFSSEALMEDIGSAEEITVRTPTLYKKYNYNSFFGRATYNWKEKYIVNASFRRDGSTRFGPGYRFGNFGAVGAAWLFTEEGFFPENNVISFGKLRASYGTTGNDQIDEYGYLETWRSTSFAYDGVAGIYPSRLANPLFRWEENKKLEASLELGFLNDKILLTTNFYRNISDNQLVDFALTPQVGFAEMTANFPATVLNTGWEFELNSTNISNKEFTWKTAFNLTVNKNKLKAFPDLESSTYKDTYVVGQSLTIVRGFQFNRIDPQTGLPEFLDLDKNDDISDPDDFVTLGKTMPDYFGGFRNTFNYKGFELDFLFQFVKQEGRNINYGYLSRQPGALQNMTIDAQDRWRKTGDIANVPKASLTGAGADYNNYRLSSAMWGDASFIRLKNLSLRYDLSKLVKRYKLNNLSVYVLGQNLVTITSYDGFDPETQGLVMPPMKTITAGLQFNF